MSDRSRVPLVDLRYQHDAIAREVDDAIRDVIRDGAFVLGPAVSRFEGDYAAWLGVPYVVGVANGTDAIELLLRALGVGPGDDVILPAMTFAATAAAVCRAGARPRLVDIAEDSLLIDTTAVAAGRTPTTRAVVAVDLYGQIAPLETLEAMGDLLVLEDGAQSHGARRLGRAPGRFGAGATTSFYPGKNLGAFGDGGAVMVCDDELAERIRSLRNHGGVRKYEHAVLGMNSRLDSLQAAVLAVKLRYLDTWNEQRQHAAARYDSLLAGIADVVPIGTLGGNTHVWHLYVIRVPERDRVMAALREGGIDAGVDYPAPIHRLGAFKDLGYSQGDFPVAERAASEMISLPLYPGITGSVQERVTEVLHQALYR